MQDMAGLPESSHVRKSSKYFIMQATVVRIILIELLSFKVKAKQSMVKSLRWWHRHYDCDSHDTASVML